MKKAYFHLPGLFEFTELYRKFFSIYYNHRYWFYEWAEIGSVYGAPADCLWGGGRVGFGDDNTREVLDLMQEYSISSRLTFSNSLLKKEHLDDRKCNLLCEAFSGGNNGVIICSDLLMNYLKARYDFSYISSTTKVITDENLLIAELDRKEFSYVVPDFRFNRRFDFLSSLNETQKSKSEFLVNECCSVNCPVRKLCYENVSLKNLGLSLADFPCSSDKSNEGYKFSKAMENPAFISVDDIINIYLPMGFSNFKIEGRGLGSAVVLEFLLYYITKPEFQLKVREEIYLDNMLDLF